MRGRCLSRILLVDDELGFLELNELGSSQNSLGSAQYCRAMSFADRLPRAFGSVRANNRCSRASRTYLDEPGQLPFWGKSSMMKGLNESDESEERELVGSLEKGLCFTFPPAAAFRSFRFYCSCDQR